MSIEAKATLFALTLLTMAIVLMGIAAAQLFPGVCLPVQGIDHNGKDEAFTVFLGNCN